MNFRYFGFVIVWVFALDIVIFWILIFNFIILEVYSKFIGLYDFIVLRALWKQNLKVIHQWKDKMFKINKIINSNRKMKILIFFTQILSINSWSNNINSILIQKLKKLLRPSILFNLIKQKKTKNKSVNSLLKTQLLIFLLIQVNAINQWIKS